MAVGVALKGVNQSLLTLTVPAGMAGKMRQIGYDTVTVDLICL
ncbi:hypothetical protein [Enterococcus sp. AZ163]